MTISQLIEKLLLVKAHSGDIEVRCQTMSHSFPPDLLVKKTTGDKEVLVLNA